MPIIIGPAGALKLNDVYNDLVDGATDLTGAAAAIAPAAVREVICAAGGLASLLGGPLGPLQGPGSRDRLFSDLGGILQAACDVPPPLPEFGPSQGPPQYTGGQCEGVLYTVTVNFTRVNIGNCNQFAGSFAAGNIPGPVGSLSLGPPKVVPCDPSIEGRNGILRNGQPFYNEPGTTATLSITSVNVQRADGLPDECGDPPGEDIDPDPIPPIPELPESPVIPPVDPDPDLPGGGGFVFKPTVGPINIGPDGGVSIPVVINVGGPSLSVPITIPVKIGLPSFSPTVIVGGSGGVSPPGGGGGGGVTAPPRLPEPVCCRPKPITGPEKEGEEGEAVEDDEPPFRGRLIGVLVKSTVNPAVARISEIGQGGGDFNLFVPRLGSLYFNVVAATDVGAETASTRDYPVKTLSQYIEAPPDISITGFRAVPEPGVSMSVSPVVVLSNEDGGEDSE